MELQGNLDSQSLQEIFTTLASNKQIGTLIVSDGESAKYIYFARAGVRLLSSGSRKNIRLGDLLVMQHKITPDQLQAVLARQEETGEMIGKILTDWGLVTEEEIDEAVASQIEEEIFDLFTWENATFKFSEGPPPRELFDPNQRATRLTFDVNSLVQKASRYVEEMRFAKDVLPPSDTIYALGEFTELEFYERDDTDPVKRVVKAIDGIRSVEEVIQASGLPPAEVADIISNLLRDKKIEQVERSATPMAPGKELQEFVQQCEQELATDPRNLALRERLAQAYFDLGDLERMAAHLTQVAQAHQNQGALEEALAVSRRIADIAPDDLENRERVLRLHFDLRNSEEVLENANQLAELYRQAGDHERVKNMYKLALEILPDDIDVRKKLINVYLDIDDRDAAAEEYDAIARIMESRGNTSGLEEIYQKILRLAPHRKDLLKKLKGKGGKPKVKIPRSRFYVFKKFVRIMFVLGILGAIGAGVWFELEQRKVVEPKIAKAEAFMLDGDFDAALKAAEKIRTEHPYCSLTILDLPKLVEKVNRAKKEEIERKRREKEEALERDRIKWEALLSDERTARQVSGALLVEQLAAVEKKIEEFTTIVGKNQYAQLAAEWLKNRRDHMAAAEAKLKQAQEAEKDGRLMDGRKFREEILAQFEDTEPALNLKMPFLIDSNPQGAEVQLDGKVIGKTPLMRYHDIFDYAQVLMFTIHKKGYYPGEIKVDADIIAREAIFKATLERKPLWVIKTGDAIETPPILSEKNIYSGSRDGYLYAIDLATQQSDTEETASPTWRFKRADRRGLGGILHAPAIAGDLVVFPHTDSYIYAVRNGIEVWSYGMGLGNLIAGPPLISGKRVVVGAGRGTLVCLPLDPGRTIRPWWVFPPNDRLPRLAVAPVLGPEGKTVYVATQDGWLHGIDILSGKRTLRMDIGAPAASPMTFQKDGLLFLVNESSHLIAIDLTKARKGGESKVRWKCKLNEDVVAKPLAYSGWVVVCTVEGEVSAFDARNPDKCEHKWTFKTGGLIKGAPIVSVSTLYVGSHDKRLYALNFWDGKLNWAFPTQWRINGLAVHENRVFATTEEGVIFALQAE